MNARQVLYRIAFAGVAAYGLNRILPTRLFVDGGANAIYFGLESGARPSGFLENRPPLNPPGCHPFNAEGINANGSKVEIDGFECIPPKPGQPEIGY